MNDKQYSYSHAHALEMIVQHLLPNVHNVHSVWIDFEMSNLDDPNILELHNFAGTVLTGCAGTSWSTHIG